MTLAEYLIVQLLLIFWAIYVIKNNPTKSNPSDKADRPRAPAHGCNHNSPYDAAICERHQLFPETSFGFLVSARRQEYPQIRARTDQNYMCF